MKHVNKRWRESGVKMEKTNRKWDRFPHEKGENNIFICSFSLVRDNQYKYQ